MILSRRVALGGIELDELDQSIVIRRVDPGVAHESSGATNRMGGWGSRLTNQHWESRDVTVTFAINLPKRQIAERRAVFDAVIAWANRKGWLTTNEMEGRRIWVDKFVVPGGGDMWQWLNEYTLTFRSLGVPFWQSREATEVRIDRRSSGEAEIEIGGTAPGTLEMTFENVSGAQNNNVKFTVGSRTLELKGVNLQAGESLVLSHRTDGTIRIMAGTRNVYPLLRGDDDTFVDPGTVTVGMTASRAGNLIVRSYARWF